MLLYTASHRGTRKIYFGSQVEAVVMHQVDPQIYTRLVLLRTLAVLIESIITLLCERVRCAPCRGNTQRLGVTQRQTLRICMHEERLHEHEQEAALRAGPSPQPRTTFGAMASLPESPTRAVLYDVTASSFHAPVNM
jgi:hypothetical protein